MPASIRCTQAAPPDDALGSDSRPGSPCSGTPPSMGRRTPRGLAAATRPEPAWVPAGTLHRRVTGASRGESAIRPAKAGSRAGSRRWCRAGGTGAGDDDTGNTGRFASRILTNASARSVGRGWAPRDRRAGLAGASGGVWRDPVEHDRASRGPRQIPGQGADSLSTPTPPASATGVCHRHGRCRGRERARRRETAGRWWAAGTPPTSRA